MSNKGLDPATGWTHEGGGVWVPPLRTSELATSEPAGTAPVVAAVATGSNPGLSAEGLAYLWEQEAHALRSAADRNCRTMRTAHAILYGKAEQLEKCAEELRRQQALPTSRQPESNAEVTHPESKP